MVKESSGGERHIVLLFFLAPAIMLIAGYFFYPYPASSSAQTVSYIPLFLGLILLGIGFFWKKDLIRSSMIKIIGWILFCFFWALQPAHLYLPSNDVFNGAVAIIGVYVLIYVAYHEWLSIKTKTRVSCLNWIAGGTFLAGIIYFSVDISIIPGIKDGLIHVVADHSNALLNILGIPASIQGCVIYYNNSPITIIFACTAIQSIVLFVGMIGALNSVNVRRKGLALLVTIVPIYFLNLIRNASVIYFVGGNITSFEMAHNVIAKVGSLIALIILLLIAFKIIPELYDEIICLVDLPKRKGPVERAINKMIRSDKT